MVAMPIIVLFFQEHGLSLKEVMIIQAIYSLSVAMFEIPSGYIADILVVDGNPAENFRYLSSILIY